MAANMAFVCLLLILGLHFGTNAFGEKELVRVKREDRVNLTVTAVLTDPFLMEVKDKAQTGNDRYEGYLMDILEEIGKRQGIGFTVNIQKDNSYNGMVQELIDKEADMAVGPLTINREREAKIDVTKPFMNAGIAIMLKKPRRAVISVDTSIFMKPFDPVVWICIILAACAVVGCFYVINRFNPHEKDNCKGHKEGQKRQGDKKGPKEQKELSFGILACLWMVLSGLTLQGYTKRPKSASALILFFVWWVFCLVVFAFYIGGILTSGVYDPVEVMNTPIQSFEDLVQQTSIRFGAVKGGSTAQFFERSNVVVFERTAKMMKDDPSVMVSSAREGVERVRMANGEYAFLAESPVVDYMVQREPCNVMKVGRLLNSFGYGFGLQQNSPHTNVINIGILELHEDGILHKLHNKWWYSTGMCSVSKPKTENDVRMCGRIIRPLSMGNIGGIFVVFFVGIVIAMIVMVIETLVHRRREAQKTDKSGAEKKDEQPLHEVALT